MYCVCEFRQVFNDMCPHNVMHAITMVTYIDSNLAQVLLELTVPMRHLRTLTLC